MFSLLHRRHAHLHSADRDSPRRVCRNAECEDCSTGSSSTTSVRELPTRGASSATTVAHTIKHTHAAAAATHVLEAMLAGPPRVACAARRSWLCSF